MFHQRWRGILNAGPPLEKTDLSQHNILWQPLFVTVVRASQKRYSDHIGIVRPTAFAQCYWIDHMSEACRPWFEPAVG